MSLILTLVLFCSAKVDAQETGAEKSAPVSPPTKGQAMGEGDLKSLFTNIGAIGVLALLVYRLPQIFQIINEGKKEIATIMKDIQNEAYTNYATNLNLIIKNSDTRVEKLDTTLSEVTKALSAQTGILQVLMDRDKERK